MFVENQLKMANYSRNGWSFYIECEPPLYKKNFYIRINSNFFT